MKTCDRRGQYSSARLFQVSVWQFFWDVLQRSVPDGVWIVCFHSHSSSQPGTAPCSPAKPENPPSIALLTARSSQQSPLIGHHALPRQARSDRLLLLCSLSPYILFSDIQVLFLSVLLMKYMLKDFYSKVFLISLVNKQLSNVDYTKLLCPSSLFDTTHCSCIYTNSRGVTIIHSSQD